MKTKNLTGQLASLSLLTLLAAGGAQAQTAPGAFYVKDGDHVVFYGDSITDQRQYTTMVETFIQTRFPDLKVNYYHSGWGGDRVGGGGGGPIDVRLQRDVLAYKPTVMTIMLGMNDGSYRAFDPGIFDTYTKGYQHILDTVKKGAPGLRITAIIPSPYDDVTRAPNFEGGYNAVLIKYGQYLKDLAPKEGLTIADFNTPVVAMLQKAKETDAATAAKLLPDRVHPSPAGHLIMAEALLKAWNAPSRVTAVEIDAAGKKVVSADNTVVTGLDGGDILTWTQADKSLPYVLNLKDPSVALSVKSSDFVESLDQEPLKVTGLQAAKYVLKVDDTEVGTFAKEDLERGINLALLPTPMTTQAAMVADLTQQRGTAHNNRWRTYQMSLAADVNPAVVAALPPLLAALDAEEGQIAQKQRAAAQPKPHRYTLTPAAAPAVAPAAPQ